MIAGRAVEDWRGLDARLRPFVARRVGNAADVDDVVQEIALRIHRGVGALRDDQRFGPWVYQVARSAIIDHARRAPRAVLLEPAPDDDDNAVERELATNLAPFIATLPSPYREALTLTELEGMTQAAAAAMLGVSVSGMKSRVQRGRERLRQALEACCRIALDARGRVVSCEVRPDGVLPDGLCLVPSDDAPSGVVCRLREPAR